MPETTPEPESEPWPDQPAPTSEEPAWRPTPQGTPYPAELPPFVEPPAPWESGEVPDEGRLPGTRRLWMAGGLAVAVLIATATAIAVLDSNTDAASKNRANHTTSDTDVPFIPGFSASADGSSGAPAGKTALSSPRPSASDSAASDSASPGPSEQGSDAKPVPSTTGPSTTASSSKPPASKPVSSFKSLQAVNYPDRYWHLSNGLVSLDPVDSGSSDSTKRDASFKVVEGLGNANCYSFITADGAYLRHRNFYLRADRNDGSDLFSKDATFCPRTSAYTGAVMLESINYPGRYLRHRNFQLRLDSYDNTQFFRSDSAFRVVNGWS
ncbi:AbfB domain-containing protein [Streptomyces sp. NBC_01136]|uniref:AbfB domain-containing protein n=1 Tax=unclassified Streptomyces TaxID=2593676 RepID=UPI0032531C20|nr:AbfB domain-containing protein [Streptomyces sp. NBC_01136]